jgi:uncharacterized membrane protein YeaQ/YmgE (transglycosylase-associated protein family)
MPEFEMMGLLSWVVMGLGAGALARFLAPGDDSMGCFFTLLVGVVGAVVGGFIATLLGFGGFRGFDLYSLIVATLGAVVLLLVVRLFRGSRR